MTTPTMPTTPHGEPAHVEQVRDAQRFQFGANWQRFLRLLDERRINTTEDSRRSMLEFERLDGLRFPTLVQGADFSASRRAGSARTLRCSTSNRCPSPVRPSCNVVSFLTTRGGWCATGPSSMSRSSPTWARLTSCTRGHHTGSRWRAMDFATPAAPTATFDVLRARGFRFVRLLATQGSGCSEFAFTRNFGGTPAVHQGQSTRA